MKCKDLFVWTGFAGHTATKTRLVMKLIAILTIVATLQVSGKGFSQITLAVKNASIKNVFQKIKEQSGVTFYYNESLLDSSRRVTMQLKNASLDEALERCFEKQPFTYRLVDNTVVISPYFGKPDPSGQASAADRINLFVRVNGVIKDENGKPLSGASVRNLRTQQSVAAGADGRFSIDGNLGDMMQITCVGYATATRKIEANQLFPEIMMQVQVTGLSDMVVVGYGSTRKKDLTGSVSVIAAKDIQDIPFITVDNALAGKAAGVQVTKSDGSPGGAVRIRVRGSTSLLGGNDPLYVIDGVPVQVQSNYINPGFDVTSPVANAVNGFTGMTAGMSTGFVNGLNSVGGLNVDDIESITILKDASSTAIYGSKAANGVVIITTKRGKKDMKPQIMFSYFGTYSKPLTPHILDAEQYKTLFRESAQNDYDYRKAAGRSIFPELDALVNHPETFFGKANTNWIDELTRNTYSNNAEISVQGGGSASKYYSSIAYNNTPGAVVGSNYQRVSGKLNVENEIGKHFRFITNLNMGFVEQDITNGAYAQALSARPDFSPFDSTGNYATNVNMGFGYQGFQNPLALSSAINNAKTFSLLGSVSGIYDFNDYLQFKSTASLNMQHYTQRNYTPSYIVTGSQFGSVDNNGGLGSNSNTQLTNWFIENTLTLDKTYREKHAVNVLLGTSYETRKTNFFSATGSGYPNDNVLNSLSSAVTPLFIKGDNPGKPQSYLISYYLRANYGYREKYLFTFTGRADGSSKFGQNNKFGYFPSGALAWRISQENFLKNVSWIDDIKFRGSYGITGTQNIGDQMYRTLYSPAAYNGVSALIPTQLGNESIKWETTKSTDIGMDFSFFKNRLQGTVDYYHKQTSNVLISLPLAPSSSYYSLLDNVAAIRNTGYELSLQGDIIRTRNFRWNASVNITWSKSKVTSLDKEADLGKIGNLTGLEFNNTALLEGQPLGLIMGMKINGVIKTQKELEDYQAALGANSDQFEYLSLGDAMFELDETGSPRMDVIIGSGAPKYFGGFTHGLTYKNMDLNLYFTYSQGGELMWGEGVSSIHFVGYSNANVDILKRYHSGNTNSDRPRLLYNDELSISNTNLSVFNSSYVKLSTATFNYRFSRSDWMRKAGLQSMSAFVSATNLFTLTSYPGNDPETSDDPYSVGGGYFDVGSFPVQRTISLGVKLGF